MTRTLRARFARRWVRVLLATTGVALALAVAGSGAALAATPKRIVSLNGDITEIIFALGYGKRVVAVDASATYPAAARKLPKIGYQRTLTPEPIIAFNPDLVIGDEVAGPQATLDQLRAAGKRVVIIKGARSVRDIPTKVRAVGKALGATAYKRAKKLAATTDKRLRAVRKRIRRVKRKPRVAFLYLRGTQVQYIGGRGSGADTVISYAGGVDAGTSAGLNGFRPLSPEALVAMKPDYIVTLAAGLQSVGGVSGLLQLPGVAETPAGTRRRILSFDDLEFLGLGPRTPRVIERLARAIGTLASANRR